MKFWNEYPLFRVLLPMILGIIGGNYFQSTYISIIIILLLFGVFVSWIFRPQILRKYKIRYITGIIISILFLLFGFQLIWIRSDINNENHYSNTDSISHLLIQIDEPLQEKKKTYKTIAKIKAVYKSNNTTMKMASGKILLYFSKENLPTLEYGDELMVKNKLQKVMSFGNPYEFNYANYLQRQDIYDQAYLIRTDWIKTEQNSPNLIILAGLKVRTLLLNILKDFHLEEAEFAVASAILLGYDEYLDQDLRQLYAGSGAMHILCVSGLHVGIIFLIFNTIFGFIKKWKYGIFFHAFLLIIIIWMYALVTGLSPSVSRAATMFSFLSIGGMMNRKTSTYNSLAASAILLLIINPYLLFHIGFQLSYMAVLAILFIQPHLSSLIETPYWLGQKTRDLIAVSISAQLGTFPLAIYYFHQFPNYFIITNLIVIPLSFIILFAGFSNILVYAIGLGNSLLGSLTTKLLYYPLLSLNSSIEFINELPMAVSRHLYFTKFDTLSVYLIILFLALSLIYRKYKYLSFTFIFLIALLTSSSWLRYQASNKSDITIYHIPKYSLIDLSLGRNSLLIGDSALLFDSTISYDRYYQENHLHKRIKNQTIIPFQDMAPIDNAFCFISENYIYHNRKRLLIVDENNLLPQSPSKESFNYVLYKNNPKISLYQLASTVNFDTIIFDGSNKYWKIKEWANQADSLNIFYWNTQKSGAFVVKMQD